jgi:hypothetical protein
MSTVSVQVQLERYPGGMAGGKPRRYAPPVIKHCASPLCFNFFLLVPKRRESFCCAYCQKCVARYKMVKAGGRASADKTRGSNPDRHISIRLPDGSRMLLHRYIYQEYVLRPTEGRDLLPYPEEIVHHVDEDKHHNCVPGYILCGNMFCTGNLELLTGDAARLHIELHQSKMQAGRHREPYTFTDADGEPMPF